MDTTTVLIALILGLATFVQSSIGFGLALISMPLLVGVIGLQQATPLVALFAVVAEVLILVRYRASMSFRAVWRLIVASLVGIPVGVYLLGVVDTAVVTTALGLLLVLYALYALFSPRLPALAHTAWGFLFGFAAGVLGGAYNTGGPPVIIYGNCRRWEPEAFKGNLQAFFIVGSLALLATHYAAGNITAVTWRYLLWSLPAAAVAMLLGFALDRHINPNVFRKLVFGFLILLGLRLIFS